MWQGTLSRRLFLLTSLWAVVAVALIALVLTEAYRRNAERRYAELLTANLYNLMGAIEPGPDGRLTGTPELGDSRYSLFDSGWYWSVEALADPANRIASPSLAGGRIEVPPAVPLNAGFQRQFTEIEQNGQHLSGVEAQVILGAGSDIYSFRITGNQSELADEIAVFPPHADSAAGDFRPRLCLGELCDRASRPGADPPGDRAACRDPRWQGTAP